SRRRHTRFSRDWSSDVCSSDLPSVRTSPGSPVTATDRALSMVHAAARAASEKLAEDILAFDVSDQLFITDAFLLCSAPNDRQVQIGRASCRERGSGWAAPGSGR